jgi:hypothetical protein
MTEEEYNGLVWEYDSNWEYQRSAVGNGGLYTLFERYNRYWVLRERSQWVADERHGVTENYNGGNLTERSNWVNGQLHGVTEEYIDGKLTERSNWVNGQLHGVREKWDSDGNLTERSNWVDGLRDGLYEWWGRISNLADIRMYKAGKIHGLNASWSPEGVDLSFYIDDVRLMKLKLVDDLYIRGLVARGDVDVLTWVNTLMEQRDLMAKLTIESAEANKWIKTQLKNCKISLQERPMSSKIFYEKEEETK